MLYNRNIFNDTLNIRLECSYPNSFSFSRNATGAWHLRRTVSPTSLLHRRRKSKNKRKPDGTRGTLSIIVRRDARVDRSNPGVIDRAMRRAISKDAFAGCIFNYFDHADTLIVLFSRLITVARFSLSLSSVFPLLLPLFLTFHRKLLLAKPANRFV